MLHAWRAGVVMLVGVVALVGSSGPAVAQGASQDPGGAAMADVTGPGQAVAQPAPQCPRTVGCQYAEQSFLPNGYRVQSLQVCGANCTTQFWIGSIPDGQQLLEIDPVRGGAIIAVARASDGQAHPAVRVVMPNYGPQDPACCPSSFTDTTYTWDGGTNTLVAGDATATPADQFPGFDATRQALGAEGWIVAAV